MSHLFRAFRPLLEDFLSLIVFAVLYAAIDNLIVAVAAGMAISLGQIAWERYRGRKIEIMQWASLALVFVLGGVSIATANPVFAMMKPSIAQAAIGCVMLSPDWMARYLPAIVTENVSRRALIAWGYVWALLLLGLSAANLFVALRYDARVWAAYTFFVPLPAKLILFFAQYLWIRSAVIRSIRGRAAELAA
ncbi:MAG TPA: septation protein IspZ [Rhizomicrobium sp.]|jgi:intracellular septation protein A|nr:septation protein IspZ [Rhizomicrobium sp.]